MSEQISVMIESLKTIYSQILLFMPKLFFGLMLFIIGWLFAKLIRFLSIKIFKIIRIESFAEKIGLEKVLLKGGKQYSTINILSNLIYWFMIFALTMATLNSFGLNAAKDLFNKSIDFIPNIIVAILILIFGILFAKLIKDASYTYFKNIKVVGAELVSSIIYWVLLCIVFSIVLQQLSIGGQIIISAFEIAFGGLCLALAIAFGVAGKEWAHNILEKLWRNSR